MVRKDTALRPIAPALLAFRRWISADPTLAFEARMYLYSSFWATVFCGVALGLNLGSEWPWQHTAGLAALLAANALFFLLARRGGRFLPLTFILVNGGLTFWLWLFNQGALGGVTFFYVATFLFGFLLLRGRRRSLALTLTLALIVSGFVLDAALPGLTDRLFQYPNRLAAIVDMATGLLGALGILSVALSTLVRNFDLERQLTHRRIRDLSLRAHTDALTGLGNRAWVNQKLGEAMELAEATQGAFSVVLADVDHFKSVNDRFGHNVGDAVLRGVADVFRRQIRKTDHVGRYGGEEFILLLSDTRQADAAALAEKIRVQLAATTFPAPASSVTSSFGVAEFRSGDSWSDLVGRADAALYRAKAQGRNCVVEADQ